MEDKKIILDFEKPLYELYAKIKELEKAGREPGDGYV